ncbi:FluC/FEX family fluoride channel [Nesterenkonia muleiensis]|uniref:FluC/FEX family fluoride channel n=1 Tax=Nesterenkonia muleiensis TaxID=2282648 RepID=UPI000E721FF5|nr:CrcB family protein [Nesterenkonia muleiensis]
MTLELTAGVVAAVAVGGAAGAVIRFVLDRCLRAGILYANTLGCLLLGVLIGAGGAGEAIWQPWAAGLLTMGLVGALSTFATVALRAAQLWLGGSRWKAVGLWSVHAGCGIAAAAAGLALGWSLAGNVAGAVVVDIF